MVRLALFGTSLIHVCLLVVLAGDSGRVVAGAAGLVCLLSLVTGVVLLLSRPPLPRTIRAPGLVACVIGAVAATILFRHGLAHAYFWARFPNPLWIYLPVLSCGLFLLVTFRARHVD